MIDREFTQEDFNEVLNYLTSGMDDRYRKVGGYLRRAVTSHLKHMMYLKFGRRSEHKETVEAIDNWIEAGLDEIRSQSNEG